MNWIGYTKRGGKYTSHQTFKTKISAVKWFRRNRHNPFASVEEIGIMDENEWRKVAQNIKRYRVTQRVGKAKYVLSYYDGMKRHVDGSDFFDVITFRNKKQLNESITSLHKQGYIQE